MMVMEVPDHPQNEIFRRSTHLIQHIKKSAHLDEKHKTESKNVIARSYIATPFITWPIPIPIFIEEYQADTDTDYFFNTEYQADTDTDFKISSDYQC